MDLTNIKTIKEQLDKIGTKPQKDLGQNFLLSHKAIDTAIESADLSKTDTVLEIGPGLGVLTFELTKHVRKVIAVERDKKLASLLRQNLNVLNVQNVEVVQNDILRLSPNKLKAISYKLIANLPYQITSPVLWKFLHEEARKPEVMVVMVQKEVAERIVASPGQMSLLSVLVQYYSDPKIVKNIKSTSFYPAPKVDSAIIKLKVKSEKLKVDEKMLFRLVKQGFANKRKMLRNNLNTIIKNNISEVLVKAGLLETARAQELSIDDWLKLYKVVYNTSVNTGSSKLKV